MFFLFNDDVFAGTEDARSMFANLKNNNKDKEIPPETKFMASNLRSYIVGQPYQRIFYKHDLKNIHIISKSEAYQELANIFTDAS